MNTALLFLAAVLAAEPTVPIDYAGDNALFIREPALEDAEPDPGIRHERPGLVCTLELVVVQAQRPKLLRFEAPRDAMREPIPSALVAHRVRIGRKTQWRHHLLDLTGVDAVIHEGDRLSGEFYIASFCRSSDSTGRLNHWILKPLRAEARPGPKPAPKTLWEISEELKRKAEAK